MENLQTGVWLDVADMQYNEVPDERLILRYDNGEYRRGDEPYPFAQCTGVLILPS